MNFDEVDDAFPEQNHFDVRAGSFNVGSRLYSSSKLKLKKRIDRLFQPIKCMKIYWVHS